MRVVLPKLVKPEPGPESSGPGNSAISMVRRACRSYEACAPEEISFTRGDLIQITVIDNVSGMWEGVLENGATGAFPGSNVSNKDHTKQQPKNIATARHSFKARTIDELTFSKGEALQIIGEIDAHFWKAKMNSKVGYVPKAYVSQPASGLAKPVFLQACFNFTARNQDELSFHQGDVITLVEQIDQAWWKGQVQGKHGIFPSNYVKVLGAKTEAQIATDAAVPQQKKKKRGRRRARGNQIQPQAPSARSAPVEAHAQVNYTRQSREELSMKKGEVLTVELSVDPKWWKVMNREGRTGMVPASLVSLSPPSDAPKHRHHHRRVVHASGRVGHGSNFSERVELNDLNSTIKEAVREAEESKLAAVDKVAAVDTEAEKHRKNERRERRRRKREKKETKAAVRVQAQYRGYRVRCTICDSLEEDEGDQVEKLVGHRVKAGKLQLKVRWYGCGPEEDEWFSAEDLRIEWPSLVDEYCSDPKNKIYLRDVAK